MRMLIYTCIAAAVLAQSACAERLLWKIGTDQLHTIPSVEGVEITVHSTSEGTFVQLINVNDAPTSVILAEVPGENLDQTRLSYEAVMASEDLKTGAYLELWAEVNGERYFSRALNDTFAGTQAERKTTTPFFLKEGSHLQKALLGVRFDGPGTVFLRNMELWERDAISASYFTSWGAIAGLCIGTLGAVWGGTVGFLVPRGRARKAVLGTTLGLAAAGTIALVCGLVAWLRDAPEDYWYTLLVIGVVSTTVFGGNYFGLVKRYQEGEERRMRAMDLQ